MASRPNALRKPTTASLNLPRPEPLSSRKWGLLAFVVLAQLAWLYWILSQPLPNASNAGGQISRAYFLWRFFPEVVPGVAYKETFLYHLIDQLSHVEYLPQRLPIIGAAASILLSALALGGLVVRCLRLTSDLSRLERLGLSFGLGMSSIAIATLILGRFGVLTPWTTRIGLLVPIAVELGLRLRGRKSEQAEPLHPVPDDTTVSVGSAVSLLLLVTPFLIIMALGAMLPTIDFDAIEYHVEGPKEYFLAGRISFLSHNVYTSMPFAVEMLHLLGMELWNDWWWGALVGQLLVASFAPMAGLMVWLFTRRWVGPRAAWVATLVYLSTPWVYRLAAIPYVEGPLCYYHAALLWGAGKAWDASAPSRSRLWVAVGLLAGGAMAIKYPALISAVIPFGAVALVAACRARKPSIVLGYALGVGLVMSPWLVKNVIDTRNPVYPLGYNVFGGRFWDEQQDLKWRNAHGPRPISAGAFVQSVLDVAGLSDWQSPLLTALAPLAFLSRERRRIAGLILGFVVYIFLTWWLFTHRLDRFWLPLLPGLAILAGLGAVWISHRVWTIALSLSLFLGYAACLIYSSTALVALNDWTGNLNSLRRSVPQMLNPPLALMDTLLAPDARPILVGQAAVFHLNHSVIYNTVFNKETIETLTRDRSDPAIREAFKNFGLTHIYVDWHEIERYRSPGNYGFTDYVTRERLRAWVESGLLGPPQAIGQKQELYVIRYTH